jgi:hypothetical protein
MEYIENEKKVEISPANEDKDIKEFLRNANQYFYEIIDRDHKFINKLDFYKKYNVTRDIGIDIGVPECNIGELPGGDKSLWLMSMTDILYICCSIYEKENNIEESLRPAEEYFQNYRHLLLSVVQSTIPRLCNKVQ